MDKKEYFLYVKGKAVPVSEEVYQAYWKITEHENISKEKIGSIMLYHFQHWIMMDTL